ncbi:MAG: ABC transporter permease [Rickettsia endosymbiont of Ixodes persulcatus]|nr:ABC transporter permease [Rickettsia endosymbiont of Ixodes persulcatus]
MAKRKRRTVRKMKQSFLRSSFKAEFPFFMMMPALLWQVLFFYIPFAVIISLSVVKNVSLGLSGGLTLDHFRALFDWPHFKIIMRSLIFAFFNALTCLFLAYPTAYFLARKVKRMKNFFIFLLLLPFWINMVVQIYAWFFLLEHDGLVNMLLMKSGIISQPLYILNSLGSIFVVLAYCYLPFMVMPLYTSLEKIDEQLIEASNDLGGDNWKTFFKITLPLSGSGIKTGFFLVFIPSYGEFLIPTVVGGSKYMFVGSGISHYFLTAHDSSAGAAFTVLSGCVLLVASLFLVGIVGKKIEHMLK